MDLLIGLLFLEGFGLAVWVMLRSQSEKRPRRTRHDRR